MTDEARGPAALLADRYGWLLDVAAARPGGTDPVALAREIRAMDAGERTTRSAAVVLARVGVEADAADRLLALTRTAAGDLREVQRTAFSRAADGREAGDEGDDGPGYVVLALAAEKLLRAWAELEPALEAGRVDPGPASPAVALLAHGVLVAAGDREVREEQFLRDLLRADVRRARRAGEEPSLDPGALDRDAVERVVLVQGAVLACERAGVSAERGAALAGVPLAAFERALARRE